MIKTIKRIKMLLFKSSELSVNYNIKEYNEILIIIRE